MEHTHLQSRRTRQPRLTIVGILTISPWGPTSARRASLTPLTLSGKMNSTESVTSRNIIPTFQDTGKQHDKNHSIHVLPSVSRLKDSKMTDTSVILQKDRVNLPADTIAVKHLCCY